MEAKTHFLSDRNIDGEVVFTYTLISGKTRFILSTDQESINLINIKLTSAITTSCVIFYSIIH